MRPLDSYLIIKERRQRQTGRRQQQSTRARRLLLGAGALLALTLALAAIGLSIAYAGLARGLPPVEQLPALLDPAGGVLLQPTRLYDRSGTQLLLELENPGVTRRFLPLESDAGEHLPDVLARLAVARLDPNFNLHPGFDLSHLSDPQPHTLAERLASGLLLADEAPSLRRALRMRLLAVQITSQYGRGQVLEWFLNSAYFGHLAYGAEAAAQAFFGKPASGINTGEAVMLIAALEAPALNPLDAPAAALAAQALLLDAFEANGTLSAADANFARRQETNLRPPTGQDDTPARAFTTLALAQLETLVGRARLERGGISARTSLDSELQAQLDCAARAQLARAGGLEEQPDPVVCPAASLLPTLPDDLTQTGGLALSAALVDAGNGQVLALLGQTAAGGAAESTSLARRASGSLLAPFIYLAGFTRGLSPSSLVWDIPASLPTTASSQSNPDGVFHGPVRLRIALANDYLAPAAQLLAQIGPDTVWAQAAPFGIPSMTGQALPFAGGTLDALEAARAYAVLANQGALAGSLSTDELQWQAVTLLEVRSADGALLLEESGAVERPIASPELAYLMNHVLSDASARWASLGDGNPLEIDRPAAAKLGQTAAGTDSWAAGYTPQLSAAVWVGTPDPDPQTPDQPKVDARIAAGVWHALMQYASRDLPPVGWSAPAGITSADVCDPSGLRPTANCPNVVSEVFLAGSEPARTDDLYARVQVNRESGLLATVFTPPALIEARVYLNLPEEARQWAKEAGLAVPPDEYDTIQPPKAPAGASISTPAMFAAAGGEVTISGSAGGAGFVSYSLQAGQGLNPAVWLQVGESMSSPVNAGKLGVWDTRALSDGLYALRLQVLHSDKSIATTVVQVTVDNSAPQAAVSYPGSGAAIALPAGQSLTLQAHVTDAVGVAKVEFWVDGKMAGRLAQGPYALPWQGRAGEHRVRVVVFDRAGNRAESAAVEFTLK